MISVKELHAGDGYAYLLRGIADGQGMVGAISPMTRYYTEAGHPPGRWMGTGLAGLGSGLGLATGSQVTEEQMERMFKHGCDPVTKAPLGRRFAQPRSWLERAQARARALPHTLTSVKRASRVAAIEAEERKRPVRKPVAGFDCVVSPPKSVSALWALSDQGIREQIAQAHYEAIDDVLRVMERDVARTRIGTDGVAQVETRGLIATAFDHYDSRAGDPQLHTHVVVANRVQGPDGKWRTLDSRGSLFPSVVAMSELYDTLIADRLTVRLGVGWERRGQPRKPKNQQWEIAGVDDVLIKEFSQRSIGIEAVKEQLIADWRQTHGRDPDDATVLRLRQQATYVTRPDKHLRSLAVMTAEWQARAAGLLDHDVERWAASLTRWGGAAPTTTLRADDLAPVIDEIAAMALAELSQERSVWRTWNIRAAAARATMPFRLASTQDRDTLIKAVTSRVAAGSVLITPPQLASTPSPFIRADGTSAFTRTHGDVFTSMTILHAEDRLLAAANSFTAPVLNDNHVERAVSGPTSQGFVLSEGQAAAVAHVATSGRGVDVLVGPAGTGKTTVLSVLRATWEAQYGPGTVVGLAPSASAADVLAESLDVHTENTAKWLYESVGPGAQRRAELLAILHDRRDTAAARGHRIGRVTAAISQITTEQQQWSLHPGQLVILDEASLAGTLALDALRDQADRAGAKLLLVGDWAQLSAVDAGGAFGMLVRDRADLVPELTDVRRFVNTWERSATVRLRVGDVDVIDTYLEQGRVRDGDSDQITRAAYDAWRADERRGLRSLLVAADNRLVRELNERARADRIASGEVEPKGTLLHDGTVAGKGDRVITRKNDRQLATSPTSWVKNGDHWIARKRHRDGSLTVVRAGGGAAITLPANYVATDVELAYSVTAHRAQGSTVDTAHAIVTEPSTTREILYVAMTRGQLSNTAYVVTDVDDEIPDGEIVDARAVLANVLGRSSAELSARETIADEQHQATSIARLAAEYETIAREAATDRWAGILASCRLPRPEHDPTASPAYPALVAAMWRAETYSLSPSELLPQLATVGELEGAEDPVAVLHHRLEQVIEHATTRPAREAPTLIAGLIPAAVNVADSAMRRALNERADLIEQRAAELAHQAIEEQPHWLNELGPAPADQASRARWLRNIATVAAYRDRHDIISPHALGEDDVRVNSTRRSDRRRAQHAIREARHAAGRTDESAPSSTTNQPTAERSVNL